MSLENITEAQNKEVPTQYEMDSRVCKAKSRYFLGSIRGFALEMYFRFRYNHTYNLNPVKGKGKI